MDYEGSSLLLVDDDTAFRQVMRGELSHFGYEVDAVGTGEEAIQRVVAAEPEVVLLDLRLPGMGGLETLKAIQAAAPATEVIMLTGHGSIDTAIEAIRIGAFDYVVKPCPLDDLYFAFKGRSNGDHFASERISRARPGDSARSRQLLHRRQPGVPLPAQSDRSGGSQRFDRAHHWRDGRGKGTGGQADSRSQFPTIAAVRGG